MYLHKFQPERKIFMKKISTLQPTSHSWMQWVAEELTQPGREPGYFLRCLCRQHKTPCPLGHWAPGLWWIFKYAGASIAQWQSVSLVNWRSWAQSPVEAYSSTACFLSSQKHVRPYLVWIVVLSWRGLESHRGCMEFNVFSLTHDLVETKAESWIMTEKLLLSSKKKHLSN